MIPVENLTVVQLKDFAIVAIAVMGFIVLAGNVKPGMSESQWRRGVDEKLDSDNKRIASLEKGNKVVCRALIAMLSHEINGNSVDKLKDAMTELQDYLIER